jgi:hypothetical protein
MPGLEKDAQKNSKPKKTEKQESGIETSEEENVTKLFILKKEYLTKNSKVIDQDVHRKFFNDAFVNYLKNKVRLFIFY